VTYETSVAEFFERFPHLQETYKTQFEHLSDQPCDPTLIFNSILIPALEKALEEGDLKTILHISAFLEDASESAISDPKLKSLISTEVGEWLGWASHEDRLAPWLGTETKRICNYVPGLATQRLATGTDPQPPGLKHRVTSILNKLLNRA
jgi:hypothetical protein